MTPLDPRTLLLLDGVPTGENVIRFLEDLGRPVLLSFSCGKDAIAAWLRLRGRVEVVPFYLYLVPGLEFVERSLRHYEEFFGTRILRLPNPALYRMLNRFVFQPPERCRLIEGCRLPEFTRDELTEVIIAERKMHAETWCVSGVRATDNLARRAMIRRSGPFNRTRRMAYPVWDLKIAGVVQMMSEAECLLPFDYEMFGRSFDGLRWQYLAPIRKHFPEDFEKIIEWFPLAELEFTRHAEFAAA